MTVSKTECEKHKAELKEHVSKRVSQATNQFQSYMEKTIDKIDDKIDKITESLVENNTNTKNLLDEQKGQRKDIETLKIWRAGMVAVLGLIGFIIPYLISAYTSNAMTEKKVREIVELHIESNYTAEWLNEE